MAHTTVKRAIAVVVATSALVLTSAGACGPAGDDGAGPGVTRMS